jgi:prophage regulatory protein
MKLIRLIKLTEVMAQTGLGRSSVYKFMKEERFPQSVSTGDRGVKWVEEEIQEWIIDKIADRDESIVR